MQILFRFLEILNLQRKIKLKTKEKYYLIKVKQSVIFLPKK